MQIYPPDKDIGLLKMENLSQSKSDYNYSS